MQLEISLDNLKKQSLFVATPMYGGQCFGMYTKSCLDLQACMSQYGVSTKFSFIFNESLITRARNYLVDEFLRSGCSHLLFIDSDIHFDPRDIVALLALSAQENKEVIGAPYPKKSIKWSAAIEAIKKNPDITPADLERVVGDYVFNPVPGTEKFSIAEPIEVLEIGTGYMMVQRGVFDKMEKAYPQLRYKPDHVGQANFDGSRYIHAYFDTVIDSKENGGKGSDRYLSEDYMFCCPSNSIIETEDGPKTIKKIVDDRYSGKVLSFVDGGFEWNRVVGWSARKNGSRGNQETKKTWVKINTTSDNNQKAKLICTDDHKIAVIDDVLCVKEPEYIPAKDIVGKYIIRTPQRSEAALYSEDQLSVLVGTLMGDASIHKKTNQIFITHSDDQYEYLRMKTSILDGKLGEMEENSGFGGGHFRFTSWAPANEQTRYLKTIGYVDGKKCPINFLPLMNEMSLAFWYMDDGSLNNSDTARLATHGFTREENLEIVEWFKTKFNIFAEVDEKKLNYKNKERTYYTLRFNKEESDKFFNKISVYIPECMEYKLPVKYRMRDKFDFSTLKRINFAASLVKSVSKTRNQSLGKLYDITVENAHNFVANRTLVHNCQWFRNIGGKIWMCPWMKTQHVGTYSFNGDMATVANFVGSL